MLLKKPIEQPTTGPNTTTNPSYNLKPTSSNASVAIKLVEAIITQNNALKQQINRIQSGLEKAGVISKGLLKQNQSLRSLYKERTNDIGKLIKTMSIQCDQEKVDYQHQCHLLQELNFATLKQIKAIDQQNKEASERIYARQFNVDEIGKIKYELEHDSLNKIRARLNNGISHESIAKAKKKLQEQLEQSRNIEKQINDLIVVNTRIGGEIDQMKKTQGPERYIITNQKNQYEQKLNLIIEENKRYIEELKNDKSELEKAEAEFQEKSDRFIQIRDNLNAQIRKYQSFNRNNSQLNQMKQSVSVKIGQSHRYQEEKGKLLNDLKAAKKDLISKIEAQKKKIFNANNESIRREQAENQRMKEHIRRLNKQMATNEADAQTQINKIRAELEKVNETIADKDYQVTFLEEEIGQFSKLIKDHPNPISEIERIELIMRLKRQK